MDNGIQIKLRKIGEYLSKLEKNPYFSENFDNYRIIACVNSYFINDDVAAFINPPVDETGYSYPEMATAFVLLDNGEIWCRTTWGHEYNLAECHGESVDTVLRVISDYYKSQNTENEGF